MIKRQVRTLNSRAFRDAQELNQNDSPEVKEGKVNGLISSFNRVLKTLSFTKNFQCSILEVSFTTGETKIISHLLGVRPKYRIILRQEGNGVLSDIPSRWDDKVAVIINNGAVTVNATIIFLKE